MLAFVVPAFYILVILQIVLGIYSFWDGVVWLRMVLKRLSAPPNFYTPMAALLCPCKGNEPGLEENLLALTKFDYPHYEIYFAVADDADPALKVIDRIKTSSPREVHVIIAGQPADCSAKVNNLIRTVESLPESAEVLVFTDSDVRLPRKWLSKLITPLADSRVGATTTYRWIIPCSTSGTILANALASTWNASIATLLSQGRDNFCWGGGTAIRRKVFDEVRVLNFWQGAVSDDFAMTNALAESRKPVVFCPECLAPTLQSWTPASLLEFTNRQIAITRVYAPKRWWLGAVSHFAYCLTLVYGAIVILSALISGDTWPQLAVLLFLVPLLAAMKGAIRVLAATEVLTPWKAEVDRWSWAWITLAPLVPFLFAWNFLASLRDRTIRWRGIRYELISPRETRILGGLKR